MNKLYKLEDVVLKVLEEQPDTRKDDFFLVFRVWEKFDERVKTLNCGQVFYNHKKLNLPTFESITRCRRKICETRKDLMDEKTTDARLKETVTYIDYAKGVRSWDIN